MPLFFCGAATNGIYSLSLHDALPISNRAAQLVDATILSGDRAGACLITVPKHLERIAEHRLDHVGHAQGFGTVIDRKSTRLNSSHEWRSYAVFCLKKKTAKNEFIAEA